MNIWIDPPTSSEVIEESRNNRLSLSSVVRYALDLYLNCDREEDPLPVDEADRMVEELATFHGYTMAEVIVEIERRADADERMGYSSSQKQLFSDS